MRQLEGAWYDGARIERSKVRIERLGYFDDVNVETPPVAGHDRPGRRRRDRDREHTGNLLPASATRARKSSCSARRSRRQNIFGTGNALTRSDQHGTVNRVISLSFTEPYWTVDGVSRRLDLYQRQRRPGVAGGRRSTRRRRSAQRCASASRSPRPTRSTSASVRAHRADAVRRQPAAYLDFVNQFGNVDQQLHVDRRLVARHPRRQPLSYAGDACRASLVEVGAAAATSRTTS